jgi:hypothetical protein
MKVWPAFARIFDQSFGILAHTLGATQAAGTFQQAVSVGSRWLGSISITRMTAQDALRFRAFLHSLRGRAEAFGLPFSNPGIIIAAPPSVPTRYSDDTTYTDGTAFADNLPNVGTTTTLFAGAGIGSEIIEIAPAGNLNIQVGAILYLGTSTDGQLVRVVAIAPGITLTIRPRLRRAYISGEAVALDQFAAPVRLSGATPAMPIVPGGRSEAIVIAIEDDY